MVIRNVTVNDCTPETIVIGRRGTFETMQVVFDLTYLIENYGDGTAVLALKRSQDSSAYPAIAAQDGNTLTWVVSEVDTYYVGAGVCQLMWYVDEGLAKTVIYPMVVMKDILSTAEEPPDGYENWIEHLTELGAETLQNAQNAAQSASEAESAKDDSVTAKEASEEAARKAEEASVHAPVIYGGYWFIWDNGQYVNTNVRAEGQKGDKGDTGEKGDTGNGIASITKTGTAGLVDTYTVTYTDGTTTTFTVTNGAKGDKGDTGATGNGIQSITKTGTSGNVDTYTITYTNGQTTTFTVTNGAVTSVAGKTGAVSLDANDVAFFESGTYDDGTVGKELSDQKNAISEISEPVNLFDKNNPTVLPLYINESQSKYYTESNNRLVVIPVQAGTYTVKCGGTSTKRIAYSAELPANDVACTVMMSSTAGTINTNVTIASDGYLALQLFINTDSDKTASYYYDSIEIYTADMLIAIDKTARSAVMTTDGSIAPVETGTASTAYAVGDLLMYKNQLYKVISAIAADGTLTPGTNIVATTVESEITPVIKTASLSPSMALTKQTYIQNGTYTSSGITVDIVNGTIQINNISTTNYRGIWISNTFGSWTGASTSAVPGANNCLDIALLTGCNIIKTFVSNVLPGFNVGVKFVNIVEGTVTALNQIVFIEGDIKGLITRTITIPENATHFAMFVYRASSSSTGTRTVIPEFDRVISTT